jgi:chlorophyll(ide) b reductase
MPVDFAWLASSSATVVVVSAGMILTDLLLEGASVANKQAFNILCEQPETAAAFLAPRIRTVVARNQRDAYVK